MRPFLQHVGGVSQLPLGEDYDTSAYLVDVDDDRPGSVMECFDGNVLDHQLLRLYHDRCDGECMSMFDEGNITSGSSVCDGIDPSVPSVRETRTTSNSLLYYWDDGLEKYVRKNPRRSQWYQDYIENPRTGNPGFEKAFRRRFRLPHAEFLKLLEKVKGNMEYFHRYGSQNARHLGAPLPIELMLLGSLRYLGRGWTFDDLAEVHMHPQLIFPSRFMCCLRPSPPPSFA
jgi:hypothetical protein